MFNNLSVQKSQYSLIDSPFACSADSQVNEFLLEQVLERMRMKQY